MTQQTLLKTKFNEDFHGITRAHINAIFEFHRKARGGRFHQVGDFISEIFNDPNYAIDFDANEIDKKYLYLRTYLIDGIYSTQLKEGFNTMVNNLASKEVNNKIINGDISVIEDIRTVYATKPASHTKDSLSFASKYCSRIRPDVFPIYDSVVIQMLNLINEVDHFTNVEFDNSTRNYPTYKAVIDDFVEKYRVVFPDGILNYDLVDKYLWTYGKKLLGMKEDYRS